VTFTDAVSDSLVFRHGHVAGLPYDELLCAQVSQTAVSTEIACQ
jgi:hypothetical protein